MERELNNAALYGESVFSSFRVTPEGVFQWEKHYQRLLKGVCFLFFHRDVAEVDKKPFEKLLAPFYQNLQVLNRAESFYCRLTFYRNAYVFAHPCEGWNDVKCNFMFRVIPDFKREPIHLGVSDWRLPKRYWPEDFKKEDFSMRQRERLKYQDFNDILFFSDEGHLLEASTSSLLLSVGAQLFTPQNQGYAYQSLELEGVREYLKQSENKNIEQKNITKEELSRANGLWLMNSVKGLVPVKQIATEIFFSYDQAFLDWEQGYWKFRQEQSSWPNL